MAGRSALVGVSQGTYLMTHFFYDQAVPAGFKLWLKNRCCEKPAWKGISQEEEISAERMSESKD